MDFVAIDILGPLPKTRTGNKFMVVLTDRFTKLTIAATTTKTKVTTVASTLLNDCLTNSRILSSFLTHHGQIFTSKSFQ